MPVGKRIRGSSRLLSVEEVAPGVLQSVTQITIEVEDNPKPAAVRSEEEKKILFGQTKDVVR